MTIDTTTRELRRRRIHLVPGLALLATLQVSAAPALAAPPDCASGTACPADGNCGNTSRCVEQTFCDAGTDGGQTCQVAAICAIRWQASCAVGTDDCGEGFTCIPPDGGADAGEDTYAGGEGGTGVCTETADAALACESPADCPQGWSCQDQSCTPPCVGFGAEGRPPDATPPLDATAEPNYLTGSQSSCHCGMAGGAVPNSAFLGGIVALLAFVGRRRASWKR